MKLLKNTPSQLVRLTAKEAEAAIELLEEMGYVKTKEQGGKLYTPFGSKCIGGSSNNRYEEEKGNYWWFELECLKQILPTLENKFGALKL